MKNKQTQVPYLVHEGEMVRLERINRRLLAALVVSNAFWLAASLFHRK